MDALITLLPGDGIGPEVTTQAMRVIDAAAEVYGFQVKRTEYPFGSEHYHALFCVGLVLLVMTLILNVAARRFLRSEGATLGRARRRKAGA